MLLAAVFLLQLTAITPVHVVDVERGILVTDQTVLLRGEQIEAVGPVAQITVPAGAVRIDATGQFLIPGLCDAHVHLIDPEGFCPLFLANGVTLVRDMGSDTDVIVGVRQRLRDKQLVGPEMLVTGAFLDGQKPVWPMSEKCPTPAAARAAVRKLAGKGVDQLKVYQLLSAEAFRAIVAESKLVHLPVVGHIPDSITLAEALGSGMKTIEHLMGFEQVVAALAGKPIAAGTPMAERFGQWSQYPGLDKAALRAELAKIKASGVVLCPTLAVARAFGRFADPNAGEDPLMGYAPVQLRAFWRLPDRKEFRFVLELLPHMKDLVHEIHGAGIPMICGTDLPNPYTFAGFSLHRDMEFFQDCDVPPADVLRSATLLPARTFGLEGRLGSIAPGKTASLVLLRQNPLLDIRNAASIERVFLRGRSFDRGELDRMLKSARDRIASWAPADRDVPLTLPGKVVATGRYRLRFLGVPAGVEEFALSEADDGWHAISHCRIEGGLIQPSVTRLHLGKDGSLRSAGYEQLSERPTRARYTPKDGKLEARADQGGDALPPIDLPFPVASMIGSLAVGPRALTLRALGMARDDERELESFTFGLPAWEPLVHHATVERFADQTLTVGGKPLTVAHYRTHLKTPLGEFTTKEWVDGRGVVVKAEIVTLFGKIEAELE